MSCFKTRRANGEMVCLTCGRFSSAQTCWFCLNTEVEHFQNALITALDVPKQYFYHELKAVSNPLASDENYFLSEECSKCGFNACACDALGYTDEPKVDCTLNHLAQALFDTDPEVLAFVERVSEAKHAKEPSIAKKRVLDLAWERDEHGWATRARERAAAIKSSL